jgi:GNAT superfamily N-acetyltransferase
VSILDQLTIDAMSPGDYAFILDSWLRSFKSSPRGHRMDDYWTSQRKTCEALLASADVLVVRPPDWPEGIAAWICGETRGEAYILHYVYVKKAVQRKGLASALVREQQGDAKRLSYTHLRPPFSLFVERMGFSYDRGLIRKVA